MTSDQAEQNAAMDITPNKDGGILKEIIREGHGDEKPFAGDNVDVHYVGTLLDGTKFDSSRDRGEKFNFDVGKGSVIKGWDLGVPTMKRGELSKFTIRGDYAYGPTGSPPTIPPNATLIFEIELFDFHGEDISENKDKSVVRRLLVEGEGYQTPNDGARCVVNLKGMDKSGRVFDQRHDVEFELGEGVDVSIVDGIEHALTRMKKGETSRLDIRSNQAWGKNGHEAFGIAPNTDVVYEVQLKSFEKAKEGWQLNGKEKIEQSELLKNKGTEAFKAAKYAMAIKKYSKIIDIIQNEMYDVEEERRTSEKLQLAANLNLGACYLKTNDFRNAIHVCEKALMFENESKNEKALFRIAQAYFGLAEYEQALIYFNKVLEANTQNKEAVHHIALTKQKIKESNEKEKALYSKMFSAFSK